MSEKINFILRNDGNKYLEDVSIVLRIPSESVMVGRPKTFITFEFEKAYNLWKSGDITAVEAMKKSNMTKATFYRKVKEYEAS